MTAPARLICEDALRVIAVPDVWAILKWPRTRKRRIIKKWHKRTQRNIELGRVGFCSALPDGDIVRCGSILYCSIRTLPMLERRLRQINATRRMADKETMV